MIQYRQLGSSGLKIAPLVFGGNVFGWTIDEKKSFSLLDAFSAAGFNCVDTTDSYSRWVPGNKGGESETIIGNLNERGFKILAALDSISTIHQTVPASIAIAWLLQQPTITAPIASATSIEQLHTLIAAVTLQLTQDDINTLNEASVW